MTHGKKMLVLSMLIMGVASTLIGLVPGAALGPFVLGTFSAILPHEQVLAWGWRVPFLLSFALLIVGLVIRARISESPIFAAAAV